MFVRLSSPSGTGRVTSPEIWHCFAGWQSENIEPGCPVVGGSGHLLWGRVPLCFRFHVAFRCKVRLCGGFVCGPQDHRSSGRTRITIMRSNSARTRRGHLLAPSLDATRSLWSPGTHPWQVSGSEGWCLAAGLAVADKVMASSYLIQKTTTGHRQGKTATACSKRIRMC